MSASDDASKTTFQNDIGGNVDKVMQIETLNGNIHVYSGTPVPPSCPSTPELKKYLEGLQSWAYRWLNQFNPLPLFSEDTPDAVQSISFSFESFRLPSTVSLLLGANDAPPAEKEAPRVFATFDEAYLEYRGRLLLLGEPGGGKTTTILQKAEQLAARRLKSPDESVPIWLDAQSWQRGESVAKWIARRIPTVDLSSCSLVYFVDGLDELGGERPVDPQKPEGEKYDPRKEFLLQVALDVSNAPLVISCRVTDYAEIRENAALKGAVRLSPLEPGQIRSFLEARKLDALWERIQSDKELLKLLQTPLLMTLFVEAYRGRLKADALEDMPLTSSDIFDAFIRNRFLHETEKYSNEQKVAPYSEAQTRKLLGALAATMWKGWGFSATFTLQEAHAAIEEAEPSDFLSFAQKMHFVRKNSGETFQFLHLKFRDYLAVSALIEALKDRESYVHWRSATALGNLRDIRAVRPLIEALKDSNADTRRYSVEALGNIGDARAVSALIEVLKDSDDYVRWSAAQALGRIGDARAVSALIEALKDSHGSVHLSAAEALGRIGDATVPLLIEALKDSDADTRRYSVEVLGNIGDARAVPALIEVLKDSEGYVRWRSAVALGNIGDARAVHPLIEALKDSDDDVHWRSVEALGNIGDARAVPLLIETLRDDDYGIRGVAANALGKIGDARAVHPLIEALKSSAYVRVRAAEALGNIGDARAVPALTEALKDSDEYVCRYLAEALVIIRKRHNLPPE